MCDANDIADQLFQSQFENDFEEIQVATQSSVPLRTNVYATSQIVCLKTHKKDEICICSGENCLDRLVYKNRVVPIGKTMSKKRKNDNVVAAVKKQRSKLIIDLTLEEEEEKEKEEEDDDTERVFESPHCLPFEKHLFVPAISTNRSSKNLYYCVYILQSVANPKRTYCGITNNRARRLRRHNGELVGGAKQTRANRPWRMVAVLNGFESKGDAGKFEWSMHHPKKRKLRQPYYGVDGRRNCMQQLLLEHEVWLDRFTNQPIYVITSEGTVSGTSAECAAILQQKNKVEIQYSPEQLRLYEISAISDPNYSCLSTLPLSTLELVACKNSELVTN